MSGPGPRVVVVGGGVIGVCAAWSLLRRGARVLLLERDGIGAGASFGNAGTVSAGHPPLNKPGRIRQALRQMMDPTSPLYVKPRWDPGLWRWLGTFARYCTEEHVEAAMEVMAPLGMEALESFRVLVEDEGVECDYRPQGYFDICRTEAGLTDAGHEAEIIRRYGYHPELLDPAGLREAEPGLGDVVGGVFYPEAATLHPERFVAEMAARVRAAGGEIREGVAVTEVLTEGGRVRGVRTAFGEEEGADGVVLATGPFSLELARRLGTHLPVQPGKGYHRDLEVPAGTPTPLRVACVTHETSVFCTPLPGLVRLAGTMEFSGPNLVMRRARLEQLTRSAGRYVPALADGRVVSEWCGLRPMSADGLPMVGPLTGVDGVVVATGHGMLGLTLGPVTGRLVADWVLGDGPEPLYRRLSPTRFA